MTRPGMRTDINEVDIICCPGASTSMSSETQSQGRVRRRRGTGLVKNKAEAEDDGLDGGLKHLLIT